MQLTLDPVKKFPYEQCFNNLDSLEKEKIKINIFLKKLSDNIFNKLESIFNFDEKFLKDDIKNKEILFYQVEEGIKKPEELTKTEIETIIQEGTILSKINIALNGKNNESFQ